MRGSQTTKRDDDARFSRRVGFVVLIVALTFSAFGLLVVATQVLLLAFAAVLGAILLDALTSAVTRRVPIPRGLVLTAVILVLGGIVFGLGVLVGPSLSEGFVELAEELPPAARDLAEEFRSSEIGRTILEPLPDLHEILASSKVWGGAAGLVTSLATGLAAGVFMLVVSVFFAASPPSYLNPAIRLVPVHRRRRVRALVRAVGQNLRAWLVARFVAMLSIGVLTGIGLWIVGIPAAASLGVLAGALSFVPNLGPILSALPGILLGLAQSPMSAVWATVVYVGVQALEGNIITPIAERQAVSLPAGLIITVQLLFGLLAGTLGFLVATPLLVTVVLTVRELYVEPLEASE